MTGAAFLVPGEAALESEDLLLLGRLSNLPKVTPRATWQLERAASDSLPTCTPTSAGMSVESCS